MPSGYPFIHPLLAQDDSCAGYLVEHAANARFSGTLTGIVENPLLTQFDKRHPWFVPAESCETTIPELIIPYYLGEPLETEALKVQENELRKAKCKQALSILPNSKLPLPGAWNYVFVPPAQARTLPPFALHGLASRTTVVALSVQNYNDHSWAKNNACTLYTGEFLLTYLAPGKKADTSRQKMLELLALIAQDAETEALNEIFRQEPKLSYSLLRIVNSAASAPRSPINSFSQAINLLGRRPLERWLQLLIYADSDDGQHPNPLLYKAAVRGRLMELLAAKLQPPPDLPNLPDNAFMIGCFSLLDVLLGISMQEILLQLPIPETAIAALAQHTGPAGKLLQALQIADSRNLSTANRLLEELAIEPNYFLEAQIASLNWASRIRQAA